MRDKVWLQEEDTLVTAVSAISGAMKTQALGKEINISLGPQATLPNNDFHALEPARHREVVFRKIKRLWLAIWKCATTHAWTIRVMHPPFLQSYERSQSDSHDINNSAPFTMFYANKVSAACF